MKIDTSAVADPQALARDLREAAAIWRAAGAVGTRDERRRPSVIVPPDRRFVVGNLIMALAEAFAFLDEAGYAIAEIRSDYNEDALVWVGPNERFIEVGFSSGAVVMVGDTNNGHVPAWGPGSHTHARDIVPAEVAATLPSIELEPGETDVTTTLPACVRWARAVLDTHLST